MFGGDKAEKREVEGLKCVIFKVQAVNLFLMKGSINVKVLCCGVFLLYLEWLQMD